MHLMPAFVKDWINSNLRTPQSHTAAFASAINAGLDVDSFWGCGRNTWVVTAMFLALVFC
jgi:hypothetical protein